MHRKIARLGEGAGLAGFLSLSLCGQMPATVAIFSQLVGPIYFQGILWEQDPRYYLGKRRFNNHHAMPYHSQANPGGIPKLVPLPLELKMA